MQAGAGSTAVAGGGRSLASAPTAKETLSSLWLQVLLYFHGYYAVFFFLVTILLYIYKGEKFFYPDTALGWEVTLVFLYAIIESVRLFTASRGNRIEQLSSLLLSMCLALPILVAHSFFLELQSYVLRIDVVLNSLAIVFVATEFLFSLGTALSLYKSFRG